MPNIVLTSPLSRISTRGPIPLVILRATSKGNDDFLSVLLTTFIVLPFFFNFLSVIEFIFLKNHGFILHHPFLPH